MSLGVPLYIPLEQIARLDIQHRWSDWDPYELLELPDEGTKNKLRKVSNRGIITFALGCTEWVFYRFTKLLSDRTAKTVYDYLETFWVYVMGNEDAIPPETEHEEWLGPVHGPINLSLMTTLNTIYVSEHGAPIQNGAFSAQIALHVLVEQSPFLSWQDNILERLTRYCPRDEDNPEGLAVPKEILDPSVELTEQIRVRLIEAFLAKVDYAKNPYLNQIVQ